MYNETVDIYRPQNKDQTPKPSSLLGILSRWPSLERPLNLKTPFSYWCKFLSNIGMHTTSLKRPRFLDIKSGCSRQVSSEQSPPLYRKIFFSASRAWHYRPNNSPCFIRIIFVSFQPLLSCRSKETYKDGAGRQRSLVWKLALVCR